MKPKTSITWTITGKAPREISIVKIDASGSEILIGIEAIVTEAAKALAKALKVPHDMAHQTILMTLNKNAGLSYENEEEEEEDE